MNCGDVLRQTAEHIAQLYVAYLIPTVLPRTENRVVRALGDL